MRFGELADAIDGLLCFGEGLAEVLEDVEHLGQISSVTSTPAARAFSTTRVVSARRTSASLTCISKGGSPDRSA